jgi:competence protein ComEA
VTTSKKVDSLREPIDVNRAAVEELQKLPGVGPKLAQRIADERMKKPFAAVDDLRRVSGIGPKTLEKLRPFIRVQ